MEKLSIDINIADRYYPIIIDKSEEKKITEAVSLINEKMVQYRQKFKGKDNQDLLAMTSLQLVSKFVEININQSSDIVLKKIKKMDEELGKFINNS